MIRRLAKFAIGAVVIAALGSSGWSLFGTAEAASGRCLCPLIYAPVKCSNGKTYPNPCVAECHHAVNCVPTGEI
jgi:hypothetical protein